MSHWFDRLATRSAEGRDDGEERLLTRRQAMRAAATGAGAVGLLSSPLVSEAWGLFGGHSRQCQCWDHAGRVSDRASGQLLDTFIFTPGVVTPMFQAAFLAGMVGNAAAYLGAITNCGFCRDDPPNKPPPPKFQPCTQRGGVRLRGDQCGGTVTTPPGGSSCPGGTSDCKDGSGACCFGSDLCCGGGCCCIEVVGCGCCG